MFYAMYRIRKRRIRLVHGRCSSYGDSAGRFSAFFETIRLYVSGRRQRQKRFTDLRRTRTSRGIYYVRPFRTACPLRFRSSSRGPRSRSARFLPTLSHATCRFTCRKHNICTCTHTRSRTRTNSVYRKNRKRSISLRRRRRLSYTVPPLYPFFASVRNEQYTPFCFIIFFKHKTSTAFLRLFSDRRRHRPD